MASATNFTHKAACAALLGFYGLRVQSWEQVGVLLALQVGEGSFG